METTHNISPPNSYGIGWFFFIFRIFYVLFVVMPNGTFCKKPTQKTTPPPENEPDRSYPCPVFKHRRTRPEYRTHTGSPAQSEKSVCIPVALDRSACVQRSSPNFLDSKILIIPTLLPLYSNSLEAVSQEIGRL